MLEKEGAKKVETEIHTKGLAPKLPPRPAYPWLQKSGERVPDLGRLRERQSDHHRQRGCPLMGPSRSP